MKGFRWISPASELSDRICETPYNVARVTTKYFMSPEWTAHACTLASNLFFISHKDFTQKITKYYASVMILEKFDSTAQYDRRCSPSWT